MKKHKIISLAITTITIVLVCLWMFKKFNFNSKYEVGQQIDSFNNVPVYYNGGVNNVTERNLSKDGYNIGLKYQCVEFVKRYYYEYFNHKMPDSYGHAKDFFDHSLQDGDINTKRNLTQYSNPSKSKPKENDLIIFNGHLLNRFGHVAIISKVENDYIEIIQQNPGPFGTSRERINLKNEYSKYRISNKRVLGWLRKK